MTSNWKVSELTKLAVLPDSAWSRPCPCCSKKGLQYDCDCVRIICHICGYEIKVI